MILQRLIALVFQFLGYHPFSLRYRSQQADSDFLKMLGF
jgi:hypothetical protein